MQLRSNWETGGLILVIPDTLPDLLKHADKANKLWLQAKSEFHFTILGSKTKKEILAHKQGLSTDEISRLFADIEALAREFTWEVTMKDEYCLLQQDYHDDGIPETRTTIIQMADIPTLPAFYDRLASLTWMPFELPHTHITIYSGSTRPDKMLRGIGVYTRAQFEGVVKERL